MEKITNMQIQKQEYKKPSIGAILGGVYLGSAVQNLTTLSSNLAKPKISQKMTKLNNSVTADEFKKIEEAVSTVIKDSGLKAKGVDVIKATSENKKEISKIAAKEIDNGLLRRLPKPIKEIISSANVSQVADGKNAFYAKATNKIVMPEKELWLAFFHEAGHAMNANLSKFGKALQKCRPMALLALPIALIALWKTKKAPDEKPKNNLDKVTTFIKNNAGKLTFATFLPMILEEGLATLKGNKFAKELLDSQLAKKVAKTNALGFSSYLLTAVLSGLGIYLGTKVKDAIAHKKPKDSTMM